MQSSQLVPFPSEPHIAPAAGSAEPMRLLGSGEVQGLISKGGTACVYEIYNEQLDVTRAVKLLDADQQPEAFERFDTEIKLSAKLDHPNIIKIFSVGRWHEQPFIEMERLQGETLQQWLIQRGAFPLKVVLAIALQIAEALHYAHSHHYSLYGKEYVGVVHRDLKPANVMVCKSGSVKIMDFGIAKPAEASLHTSAGNVVGTMQYLAPEQLEGTEVDHRADVYAFGLVLYEMFTGKTAFDGGNLAHLVTKKLAGEFVPLTHYKCEIPAKLLNLTNRCLQTDQSRRPPSMLPIVKHLQRLCEHHGCPDPKLVIAQWLSQAQSRRIEIKARGTSLFSAQSLVILLPALAGVALLVLALGYLGFTPWVANEPEAVSATDPLNKPAPLAPVPKGPAEQTASAPTEQPLNSASPAPPKVAPKAPPEKKVTAVQKQVRVEPKPRPAPVQKVPPKPSAKQLVAQLEQYMQQKKYLSAREVFLSLPQPMQAAAHGVLQEIRISSALSHSERVETLLLTNDLFEGEFLLEKALYFFKNNNIRFTEKYLQKAFASRPLLLSPDEFSQRKHHYAAMIYSATFGKTHQEADKQRAIEHWQQLAVLLEQTPSHPLNKVLRAELQKLGIAAAVVAGK